MHLLLTFVTWFCTLHSFYVLLYFILYIICFLHLIVIITTYAIILLFYMNLKYDPLARYPADIERGIMLLEELYKNPDETGKRDYIYYLAIGNARLKVKLLYIISQSGSNLCDIGQFSPSSLICWCRVASSSTLSTAHFLSLLYTIHKSFALRVLYGIAK